MFIQKHVIIMYIIYVCMYVYMYVCMHASTLIKISSFYSKNRIKNKN